MKSYSEMCRCGTFEERLAYLQLHREVGKDTFGFDRYLNQDFYRSKEWRQFRDRIIVRDGGCDLGCKDHPIADIAVSGGKMSRARITILTSVKKLLGIAESYTAFDADIIMHINAVFLVLQQLGVGPEKGFGIVDASAVWDDFLPGDERAKAIASYMGAKVRLAFDPPQSSTAMEALKNTVAEMEFRLNIEFDKTEA